MFQSKYQVGKEFYHHSSDNPYRDEKLVRYARITHIESGRYSKRKYVKFNIYEGWGQLCGQDTLPLDEFESLYPLRRGS